mgnify:FL=1
MRHLAFWLVLVSVLASACARPQGRTVPSPTPASGEVGSAAPVQSVGIEWAGGSGRLVVQEAELLVESADIRRAADAFQSLTRSFGGYVGVADIATGTESSEPNQAKLTLLVPADRFEEFLAVLKGSTDVLSVRSEVRRQNDVTDAVIDYAARRRSLERTEARLQQLLERATTIDEVLRVEQELTRVRTEIERIAAQQAELERRIAYAEVRVLVVPPTVTESRSLGETAREAWRTSLFLLRMLLHGIVWAVILSWWLLAGAAAAAVVLVGLWRRRRALGRSVSSG